MSSKSFLSSALIASSLLFGLSSCDFSHTIETGFTQDMQYDLGKYFEVYDISQSSASVRFDCELPIGMEYESIGVIYKTTLSPNKSMKSGYYDGKEVTVSLSSLQPETNYEVYAYVLAGGKYYYGANVKSFTTHNQVRITLDDVVDNKSSSQARVYLTVSSDTYATEIGYCIGESHNPTTSNRKEYRSNYRSFSDWTSVDKGKRFYARPYTKDSNGHVSYGNEVEFNTIAITNPLTVTNAKYQAKYVDGTYYYYHYTINYSFSYYGSDIQREWFHIDSYETGDWYWDYTYEGQRTGSEALMKVSNPSPIVYYAYAVMKDGTKVYGIKKKYTISFQ